MSQQFSFCSSFYRYDTNFAPIWSTFRLFWSDPIKIPNMLATSMILTLRFPMAGSFYPQFHLCYLSMDILSISTFNRGHAPSELTKQLTTLCFSHCLFSRTYFQHFESLCSFFPSLNNLKQTLFFFLVCQISKCYNEHVYLVRHYSTMASDTALLPSRKWLSTLLLLHLVEEDCASRGSASWR